MFAIDCHYSRDINSRCEGLFQDFDHHIFPHKTAFVNIFLTAAPQKCDKQLKPIVHFVHLVF